MNVFSKEWSERRMLVVQIIWREQKSEFFLFPLEEFLILKAKKKQQTTDVHRLLSTLRVK